MSPTHKCDYCGQRYFLNENEAVVTCSTCGQRRIYDLVNKRRSEYYHFEGHKEVEVVEEADSEEEALPKKTRKTSKDIKQKRTCNSFSMKSKMRNAFRGGSR